MASGPLTMRFLPPIGTFLYWLRPGTIRQPPWPDRVRGTAGSRRTIVDIVLYLGVIAAAVYVLLSPADRAVTGLGDDAFNLIEPARFLPLLIVLPIMGLRDKTIFLAARSEHYWVTAIVFLFPFVDMIVAAKLLMVAIWWGAATSKLNRHFPYVVSTMMSNAPLVPKAVKRRLWRDAEFDVRPGMLSRALAHGGTVIEFGVPLILLLSRGGWVTTIALIIMILFHLQILTAIPMGVPLEWNVLMMFGAVFLFGHYSEYGLTDVTEPFLVVRAAGAGRRHDRRRQPATGPVLVPARRCATTPAPGRPRSGCSARVPSRSTPTRSPSRPSSRTASSPSCTTRTPST